MASACLLATSTAAAILVVSDTYEFSWRYQLPAMVLLPLAGVLGITAIAAKVRFELAAWSGLRLSRQKTATSAMVSDIELLPECGIILGGWGLGGSG
jgi:hypothetical protein